MRLHQSYQIIMCNVSVKVSVSTLRLCTPRAVSADGIYVQAANHSDESENHSDASTSANNVLLLLCGIHLVAALQRSGLVAKYVQGRSPVLQL